MEEQETSSLASKNGSKFLSLTLKMWPQTSDTWALHGVSLNVALNGVAVIGKTSKNVVLIATFNRQFCGYWQALRFQIASLRVCKPWWSRHEMILQTRIQQRSAFMWNSFVIPHMYKSNEKLRQCALFHLKTVGQSIHFLRSSVLSAPLSWTEHC
jgi:hypothetical protein